jgi:hypothetical protein
MTVPRDDRDMGGRRGRGEGEGRMSLCYLVAGLYRE